MILGHDLFLITAPLTLPIAISDFKFKLSGDIYPLVVSNPICQIGNGKVKKMKK